MKKILFLFLITALLACSNENEISDAFGNFETDEIIISSEINGKVILMTAEEGMSVKKGMQLVLIDTTQIYLQKLQILASIASVEMRMQDISSQTDVFSNKIDILNREKERISKLLVGGAATQKQYDDIDGEITSTHKQLTATQVKINDANRANLSQKYPLLEQIKILDDQIAKAKILAPIDGIILGTYSNNGEFAKAGFPLLKIANIDKMYLKAFVSADMISSLKIGNNAEVIIDGANKSLIKYSGKIVWISDKAEFTPKIVQTKEQRTNLVYAVKLMVNNDGKIKIGMPGEVNFK